MLILTDYKISESCKDCGWDCTVEDDIAINMSKGAHFHVTPFVWIKFHIPNSSWDVGFVHCCNRVLFFFKGVLSNSRLSYIVHVAIQNYLCGGCLGRMLLPKQAVE